MTRDDRGRTNDMDAGVPRDDGADASRPLDFSALKDAGGAGGRRADAADRWEALARRIEAAAAPELARRAARTRHARTGGAAEVLLAIARSARPALLALAASAVLAFALSRAAVATSPAAPSAESSLQVAEVSVARALRVDEPAASWLVQQRAPSADDLARAIDPEAGQ